MNEVVFCEDVDVLCLIRRQCTESSKKGSQFSSQGNKRECSFCGRSGHLEERCYAKQAASKAAKEEGKSQSTTSHTNFRNSKDSKAKVAYVVKASSSSTRALVVTQPSTSDVLVHSNGEWIADSGASAHMTHSSSHLRTISP